MCICRFLFGNVKTYSYLRKKITYTPCYTQYGMKEELHKLEQLKLNVLKYKIFYYQMFLDEKAELSINYIKKQILWMK